MNFTAKQNSSENDSGAEAMRIANEALVHALSEFELYQSHWICQYNVEKNEVLYFFPLGRVNKLGEKKSDFIRIIREHWINSGFEIVEQNSLIPNKETHVNYDSLFFCLKKTAAMKKNLCLDKTSYTDLAAQAILPILKKSYFRVGSWTYGVDTETGDILVFFPLKKVEEMNYGKYHFFASIKKAVRDSGFKVVEQVELPKYEYSRVGFASVCFRLQRIIYFEP